MNYSYVKNEKDLEEIEKCKKSIDKSKKTRNIVFIIISIVVALIILHIFNYESNYYEENHSDSVGWGILIFGPIFVLIIGTNILFKKLINKEEFKNQIIDYISKRRY